MKAGAPPLEIGMVDVRDVAEAHMRAGFVAAARWPLHRHPQARSPSCEIGQALRAHFGDRWPFPTRKLPKWLLWVFGPMISKSLSRQMIADEHGTTLGAPTLRNQERELGPDLSSGQHGGG
jgi:hypothetical protein